MKRNNLVLVLTTLFILVASCFFPSSVNLAKAQSQFPNCVNGVCTFPLARSWGDGGCEFNVLHTLEVVGQKQNFWLIPKGNVDVVSFNTAAKSMTSSDGYRNVDNDDNKNGRIDSAGPGLGENMPGRCACDVASMFYITGTVNGLNGDPDYVDHYLFPGVTDKKYSVEIWNPGKDLRISNPFDKDAVYHWKFENGSNIVMWVEVGGEVPEIASTPQPEETPEIEKVEQSADSGPVELYRIVLESILDSHPLWKVSLFDSGLVDEELLIKIVNWSVWILVTFIFLFLFVILRAIVNKEAGGKVVIKYYGHIPVMRQLPRGYFNGWYWLFLLPFLWLVRTQDDYVLRKLGTEVWWIMLGLTIFFWFAKRVEVSRIRAERGPTKFGVYFWNWGVGTLILLTAAYVWGITIGLILYSLSGLSVEEGTTTPLLLIDLPSEPLEWKTPLQDIPDRYKEIIREYGPEVVQIAREEGVPPEVIFTLVFKEGGQLLRNPANGEGYCGFHDLVVSGQAYFPPGEVSREDTLKQFRLCAQEFKKRSAPYNLNFETTDFEVLGPIYMRYNGNIDCKNGQFASYREHPYVMNGWDESHTGMIARDGNGGCVALKVIGALPAHVRIGNLLRDVYTLPPAIPNPVAPDPLAPLPICSDPKDPCGFALPGGSSQYVQGTEANGGKGVHDGAYDWWKVTKLTSDVDPIPVLSMLNATVSKIGRYANGGLGGGTTYLYITNGRWTQRVYHCDDIIAEPGSSATETSYVKVGDTVTWGQPLCLMGNQGQSAWTHLDLRLDGPDGPITDQTRFEPK